jgi:hypothetical protein
MKKILTLCVLVSLSACGTIVGQNKTTMVQNNSDYEIYGVNASGRALPHQSSIFYGMGENFVIESTNKQCPTQPVDTTFNGWVIGNLVFGGVIGVVVDALSGSIMDQPSNAIYSCQV